MPTYKALRSYGAYLADATPDDFSRPGTIFQIGVAPFRIDILCDINGLTFDEAWAESEPSVLDDGTPIRYISAEHLIRNKLAAGRDQDLLNVKNLRHAEEVRRKTAKRTCN